MTVQPTHSFTQRMIGAAKVDAAIYTEVEHDTTATGQAAGVVAIVAVCSAIGGAGGGFGLMISGIVAAVVGWLVWSGVTYLIGDKMLGGTATWGELLRALGFAQAPGVLYIFSGIPALGLLVRFVVGIWVLVCGIVALREALDFSTGKAILTAVLGWLAMMIVTAVLFAIAGGPAAFSP
ncbi:MAG: YIP1 family protein [Gemmatimonadota bacterium]